ncbi:hypothetical protein MNBD_ALPHA06-1549, partial [hydrothermal vent metagenome]
LIRSAEYEQTLEPGFTALFDDDTLSSALALMRTTELESIPVRQRTGAQEIIGKVTKSDALLAYNQRLEDELEERHG